MTDLADEQIIERDPGLVEAPPLPEPGEVGIGEPGPSDRAKRHTPPPTRDRFRPGDEFILDAPEKVEAIWGRGEEVVWPRGEPFLIVGPDGVGKGTVGQQLALGIVGVPRFDRFLGLPVNPREGGVLYVAADRPQQIRRSWRRMVEEKDRASLRSGVTVWRGPLPFDLGADPDLFTPWLAQREARVVILDSLGALARDPASDETGSGIYRALMEATAEGFEVCSLYHPRKPEQTRKSSKRVNTVADVYGSRWITAAAGSIVYLDGQPGDLIVHLRHLKQPADEVGPLTLRHDHDAGRTGLHESQDLVELAVSGITAKEAAASIFDTSEPDRNEVEKARRRLDKLADRGDLRRESAVGDPTTYWTVFE